MVTLPLTHLGASDIAYRHARNAIAHLPPVRAAVEEDLAPRVVLRLVLALELDCVIGTILNLKLRIEDMRAHVRETGRGRNGYTCEGGG